LPRGLTLGSKDGRIHGTPTATGTPGAFTIEARDASAATSSHRFVITVASGELLTESLPPAVVGEPYLAAFSTRHLAAPLNWEILKGKLPEGIELKAAGRRDSAKASVSPNSDGRRRSVSRIVLRGTPRVVGRAPLTLRVTDANGESRMRNVVLRVLPKELIAIKLDRHTVALFDWQGPNGKLIPDRLGNVAHTLTWTNMGGDMRMSWPGRVGRFPYDNMGHGEHGWAIKGRGNAKLDLKTCTKEWTVEAWVRRAGPIQGHGTKVDRTHQPFDYGHICGSYDNSKRGVWELYLSDHDSPDGSMAPGVHFLGARPEEALMDLHPWKRPRGIVGTPNDAGIRDTEWHHVAWQYNYAQDLHELFLDGQRVWRMKSPDGRKLVNNRRHEAQFSVSTRLNGYSRYGGNFNFLGFGNFFGQIGEIRISNTRRYR